MSDTPEMIVDRTFSAPRDLVWKVWTDPQLLARWYGPGAETTIHKFDLKPGGLWLNEMRWGQRAVYARIEFSEVTGTERLVWTDVSSDADWNPAPPMMPNWPQKFQTIVTFTDDGAQTHVQLRWSPVDASDAEKALFAEKMDDMGGGWGSGFAIIDEMLVELG